MPLPDSGLTGRMANALRFLAIDAVEQAQSGHPGAPMGMAEMALALWHKHLRHNPANPAWANRDRFVLSNGHASMLLYALLHLTGYDLPMDEIKRFRQLRSKTPGHPEVGVTPGVEVTTGPLGQGLANAVGMALAEKLMAAEFNQPGLPPLVDHFTYVFVGDGCLMEGISHEACSLAGTLRLSKLIVLYDDNGISIDGEVKAWFDDNTVERFRAYGWHVIPEVNGHDHMAIDSAIEEAKTQSFHTDGKPVLICCKTLIGKGAPHKAGSNEAHGAPLGADEISATRVALDWGEVAFVIPDTLRQAWDGRIRGKAYETAWQKTADLYRSKYPKHFADYERRIVGELPSGFIECLTSLYAAAANKSEAIATRKASYHSLNFLSKHLPELLGGSADLTSSNLTLPKDGIRIQRDQAGAYLSYGVREFAMAAIMNGIALHGGYIPYGGTFLTFSDYSRNAIRMAALMHLRVIHVLTHDSIGIGEDGPTHQSIEQVPSLRLIPNLDVWRPADGLETAVAWAESLKRQDRPTALILSRQETPQLIDNPKLADMIAHGGYILKEQAEFRAIIIGTGTETALAFAAHERLAAEGIRTRLVSMPSTTVFDRQDEAYRKKILPSGYPVVVIEAAHSGLWWKYLGGNGVVIGIDSFGESAPAVELYRYFGITSEAVVVAVKRLLDA